MAALMPMVRKSFSNHAVYTIMVESAPTQSSRRLPIFVLFLPSPELEQRAVPTSVQANASKARTC